MTDQEFCQSCGIAWEEPTIQEQLDAANESRKLDMTRNANCYGKNHERYRDDFWGWM